MFVLMPESLTGRESKAGPESGTPTRSSGGQVLALCCKKEIKNRQTARRKERGLLKQKYTLKRVSHAKSSGLQAFVFLGGQGLKM